MFSRKLFLTNFHFIDLCPHTKIVCEVTRYMLNSCREDEKYRTNFHQIIGNSNHSLEILGEILICKFILYKKATCAHHYHYFIIIDRRNDHPPGWEIPSSGSKKNSDLFSRHLFIRIQCPVLFD